MANNFIKAERVVRTALGLLERQVTLPRLVWRDAAGDFRGAKNDTITIRLPAYSEANSRALRSGANRSKTTLTEVPVNVSLDTNLYNVVDILDEELTLDIENFDRQITLPVISGIARGIENQLVTEMSGATYQHTQTIDPDAPHVAIAAARRDLNDSNVPMDGRALAVGSAVEETLLTNDQFVRADASGSDEAFRNAMIGRVYGFPVFTVPGLDPDEAYAFHRTAYVLNGPAPIVPRGAPWGATMSWEGFAIRVLQVLHTDDPVDQFHADVFTGTNIVADYGEIDEDGKFVPSADPDLDHDDPIFVRAVKLTLASS